MTELRVRGDSGPRIMPPGFEPIDGMNRKSLDPDAPNPRWATTWRWVGPLADAPERAAIRGVGRCMDCGYGVGAEGGELIREGDIDDLDALIYRAACGSRDCRGYEASEVPLSVGDRMQAVFAEAES